jgi:hypothetical protein
MSRDVSACIGWRTIIIGTMHIFSVKCEVNLQGQKKRGRLDRIAEER